MCVCKEAQMYFSHFFLYKQPTPFISIQMIFDTSSFIGRWKESKGGEASSRKRARCLLHRQFGPSADRGETKARGARLNSSSWTVRIFSRVRGKNLPAGPTFWSLISCIFLRSRTRAERADEVDAGGEKDNRGGRETGLEEKKKTRHRGSS